MIKTGSLVLAALAALAAPVHAYDCGRPKAPVIPQADGFFETPGAAMATAHELLSGGRWPI